jgi:hypothetical protein
LRLDQAGDDDPAVAGDNRRCGGAASRFDTADAAAGYLGVDDPAVIVDPGVTQYKVWQCHVLSRIGQTVRTSETSGGCLA